MLKIRPLALMLVGLALSACGTGAATTYSSVNPGDGTSPVAVDGTQSNNGFTGGASMCGGHAFSLCDGFETVDAGQQPNAALWTVEKLINAYGEEPNGAIPGRDIDNVSVVEVSTARAARGSKSVHILVPNSGKRHDMIANRTVFPTLQSDFWGRVFVYEVTPVSAMAASYITASGVPQARGNNPGAGGALRGVDYTRVSTLPDLGVNDSMSYNTAPSTVPLPTNTWACLEWHYDGNEGTSSVYLNGSEVATLTQPAPVYDTFRVGWETYGTSGQNPNFEMYVDEVAVGASRIGCAN